MIAPSQDGAGTLEVEGLRASWADGVLDLVLDRPETRNALSIAMRRGIIRAVRAADADPGTRVVVLTGADPAFSGGVDLTESLGGGGAPPSGARTDPAAVVRVSRTPVIAAVNGVCYTGALELALSCSFLIASERATFADTHASVGLLPGWGQSALLPRAVGVRFARQLMLTGEPVDARTALRTGLVNEVVPHERLLPRARARRLRRRGPRGRRGDDAGAARRGRRCGVGARAGPGGPGRPALEDGPSGGGATLQGTDEVSQYRALNLARRARTFAIFHPSSRDQEPDHRRHRPRRAARRRAPALARRCDGADQKGACPCASGCPSPTAGASPTRSTR